MCKSALSSPMDWILRYIYIKTYLFMYIAKCIYHSFTYETTLEHDAAIYLYN